MKKTPKTAWVKATGPNHRGEHPDLDYQVPVEVDRALLPYLLALPGVVEISTPETETPAAPSAPETKE